MDERIRKASEKAGRRERLGEREEEQTSRGGGFENIDDGWMVKYERGRAEEKVRGGGWRRCTTQRPWGSENRGPSV